MALLLGWRGPCRLCRRKNLRLGGRALRRREGERRPNRCEAARRAAVHADVATILRKTTSFCLRLQVQFSFDLSRACLVEK